MAKSSYIVKPANIFGQIGQEMGRGLSEAIPREAKMARLSQGLKQFEQEAGNLTPIQQLTRLASIPGLAEHPQLVQSFAELAKQQGIRNAYARGRDQGVGTPQQVNPLSSVEFGQLPGQLPQKTQVNQSQNQIIPSNVLREEEAKLNPPAATESPLSEKFVPPAPWNSAKDEQAINEAFDRGLATTFPEARAYADRQKELYESAPEKYRAQLDYKKGIDKEVDDLFDKHLQTRLQKSGEHTFADVPGDLQLNIKKVARNAVATGKMTPEQAAETYSKKALDLVKDKGEAIKIANRDVLDRLLPRKKEEAIKKLQGIAKNYSDMGSEEDFYNFLQSDIVSDNGMQQGMGLSPGGAAIIQYPRTEKVKSLIKNTKISSKNPSESTRDFAQNLFDAMTPRDSFLAIARQMKQQDENFDEYAFFDYLRDNRDKFNFNKRLDREIHKGVSDFFPNWRDIGLFPAFGKSVAND